MDTLEIIMKALDISPGKQTFEHMHIFVSGVLGLPEMLI